MTNNTVTGVKKSQFTAQTTIPGAATLDYVSSGTNYKITYTNFLAGLGVTGSITQVGDPLDVPVLDIQGTVNGIRNINAGFGVTAAIDGNNSISLSTNYTFDNTGAALVDDVAAAAPAFRSLVAGADVTLTEAIGTITVALNPSSVKPNNQVIINQPSDFPAAVGGKIPTVANTEYYIGDCTISVADTFTVAPNVTFSGAPGASCLTYTGTGKMFEGGDLGLFTVRGLVMDAPNSTDDVFTITDTVQGSSTINFIDSRIISCNKVGTFQDTLGVIATLFSVLECNDGISFLGLNSVVSINRTGLFSTNAAFKGVDLGSSTSPTIEVSDLLCIAPAGGFGISGLAANGNVVAGSIATVNSCEFLGGMSALENITSNDFRWSFLGNSGISDTNPDGLVSLTANATNTVISAINTPTKIAGTFVPEGASHFTADATGRITYNGEREITVPVDLGADIQPASGTNKDLKVYIALNGTEITQTGRLARVDSGNPQSLTSPWQVTFMTNDYVDGFVENTTDAIDILVSGAVLRVR